MDVDMLLSKMSLEEKVGQLFMLAFSRRQLNEARVLVQEYAIGSFYLSQENASSPEEMVKLVNALREFTDGTRLALPPFLAADQEGAWGILVPYSTTGPGNLALGVTGSPELVYEMYRIFAVELEAVGLNTILAPCADVNSNPQNPIIGMRSFGEDPQRVGVMVAAAVRGIHAGGMIATAKHFPGHGDTAVDSHRGLPIVQRSLNEMREIHLYPFQEAIKAGVEMIMTAHILFPALDPEHPATLSPRILQGLLREEMGFQGVILSDSMNMGAIQQTYGAPAAIVQAIVAGVDMILLAEEHYDHDPTRYLDRQISCLKTVFEAVREGLISEKRIDEAVRRILRLKKNRGLFEAPRPTMEKAGQVVGHPTHRELERQAAQAAVTVLRDRNNLLPIRPDQHVVLINATPQAAYSTLLRTRGIGPNQSTPAFVIFKETLERHLSGLVTFEYEDLPFNQPLPEPIKAADRIIVVTENYPLPGIDFDLGSQKAIVSRLILQHPDRLIVVGLRDPYELLDFPDIGTYLCTYSSRPCAAEAAARAVLGQVPSKE